MAALATAVFMSNFLAQNPSLTRFLSASSEQDTSDESRFRRAMPQKFTTFLRDLTGRLPRNV